MRMKSKALLGFFTLALCAPLALAQDGGQGQMQPPPQQGQGQSQDQMPRRMGPGRGQMGPDGGRMGMNRDGMRDGMHSAMRFRDGNRFQDGRPMWGGGMGMRRGPMGPGGMNRGMFGRGFAGGRGMAGRGQMPLNRIVNNPSMREKLGITADQAAKINAQETDFRKAGIQSRASLEVKHLELNQLMSAPTPDRAAIDRKLQEISAVQLTSEQTNVHHRLDMKAALTPDQQAKLKDLMQSRRPGGQRGPGGPGGPGMRRPQPNKQSGPGDQSTSPDGVATN